MEGKRWLFLEKSFFELSGIFAAVLLSSYVGSDIYRSLGKLGWTAIFYIIFSIMMRTRAEYLIHKN